MIIKCKMCGGDIQFNPGDTNGQCDHCGCTTTFPKLPDEQRANLFNRANHFRRQCEFDKAMAAYEHILEEDDTDAEAHWGIVLSKFGIEYVEDPITHERIPTCHRAQVISILSDEDYQNALKYAPDTYSREIYEKEAKRIAEIQKGILAISSQEKPYDVFICYKETDDSGSRTKDSTLAQEIYYQLTNEGYKVFFSRITLEDKLGQEYEPYIFAALNSAKVMLVVGTKPEFFNAVWVKNEWNRYLALMKNDRKRVLIPCYRDMDPYDLPEELSSLQSQDMGKIGFMQDIIHGVKKVLGSDKRTAPNVTVQAAGPGIASLQKRAVLFLEDNDWDSATEYFDRILDIDPEYAPAYIGKVQVKNKVRREADLARCREPISNDPDFQKAVRFADEKQKTIYNGYNRAILDRIELERKEAAYREAVALENRSAAEADFLAAARKYDSAGEIRDAKDRAANCRAKASSAKAEAEKAAAVYKEQMERERKERARQEEEQKKAAEEQRRLEEQQQAHRKQQNKKILIVVASLLVLAVGAYFANSQIIQPKAKYNKAEELLNKGQYTEAIEAFTAMNGYGDAESRILQATANQAFDSQNYSEVSSIYTRLPEKYQNHKEDLNALYNEASTLLEQGKYDNAIAVFNSLGNFTDSAEKIKECKYQKAFSLKNSGDKENASVIFVDLGDYRDSKSLNRQIQADALYDSGEYDKALAIYSTLEEPYQTHVQDYVKMYDEAKALLDASKYGEAIKAFSAIKSYSDSSERIKESTYLQAVAYAADAKYDEAIALFTGLSYQDSSTLILKAQADKLFDASDYAGAYDIYATVDDAYQTHKEWYSDCYNAALASMAKGDYSAAYNQFAVLGNYSDSKDKTKQSGLAAADKLLMEKKYDEAAKIYQSLGDNEKAKQVTYEYALSLMDTGEYVKASEQFSTILDYSDSQEQRYQAGIQAMNDGLLEDACSILKQNIEYSEAQETLYQIGLTASSNQQYNVSVEAFSAVGTYKDAAMKLTMDTYTWADQLYKNGDYEKANKIFMSMGDFSDAPARSIESAYQAAKAKQAAGNYSEAKIGFSALGDYEDSKSLIKECDYFIAKDLHESKKYEEAYKVFVDADLHDYKESSAIMNDCCYELGTALMSEGKNKEALEWLNKAANYKDASNLIQECHYKMGMSYKNNKQYDEAILEFESVSGYQDSAEIAKACYYALGQQLETSGKYEEAYEKYILSGSTDKIKEAAYQSGMTKLSTNNYSEAITWFEKAGNYQAASEQIVSIGEYYYSTQQYGQALMVFKKANHFGIADQRLYELGKYFELSDELEKAIEAYQGANGYSDSTKRSAEVEQEIQYRSAISYIEEGKYYDARTILLKLEKYKDSYEKLNMCEAAIIKHENAIASFSSVGNFITFGTYPQTTSGNDKTPIEWQILDLKNDKALIISRFGLDIQYYHSKWGERTATWESCSLRKWLNDDFYNKAFSMNEKSAIALSSIDNSSSQGSNKDKAGPNTMDNVFLLSYKELFQFFPTYESRMCAPTNYTIEMDKYGGDSYYHSSSEYRVDGRATVSWWLRTGNGRKADVVLLNGEVSDMMRNIYTNGAPGDAVRPVLWVNLSANMFWPE